MTVDHPHTMNGLTFKHVLNNPIPLCVNGNGPFRCLEYYLPVFGHDDIGVLPISVWTIIAVDDFPVHQSQVGRVYDDLL